MSISEAIVTELIESYSVEEDINFCKKWLEDRNYELSYDLPDEENDIVFSGHARTTDGWSVAEIVVHSPGAGELLIEAYIGDNGDARDVREVKSLQTRAEKDADLLGNELKNRHTPLPYDPFDL